MRCIVTGATGFIGRALLPRLLGDGIDVTTLGRRPARPGTPWLYWDAGNPDRVPPLPAASCVVHLAGIAHRRATPACYRQVNVEATLALARAALRAGVRRFVYVSSVNAGTANEPYGRSKLEAERGLAALGDGSGLRCLAVRPALVYGPAARGNLARLRRLARLGIAPPERGAPRPMIGRDDLVELLRRLLDAPLPAEPRGGMPVWYCADGEAYDLERLWRAYAAGRGRPWIGLPSWCWRAAFSVLDGVSRVPAGSTRARLVAAAPAAGSAHRVPAVVGWQPRQTLESALAQP